MAEQRISMPLALQSIYIRSSSTKMAAGFFPNLPGKELVSLYRSEGKGRMDCNTTKLQGDDGSEQEVKWCAFITRFQFVYARPKADGSPHTESEIESHLMAQVEAEIVATYALGQEDFPETDFLHKWGRHNALLHTWPYWREFCHNSLLRMDLPVTMIPLIEIIPPDAPPP